MSPLGARLLTLIAAATGACSLAEAPSQTSPTIGGSPTAGTTAQPVPAASTGGQPNGTAGTTANGNTTPSMLTLKQPIERDGKLVLEFGSTYFAVDPNHGARIVSLRVAGHELLQQTGAENFRDAFGSTFWPSPQTWPWPPPAEIDTMAYSARVDAGALLLTAMPHGGTQLQIEKRFSADLTHEALLLEYAMTNTGEDAMKWAPWEITRMPAQGLAFWPTGSAPFGDAPMTSSAALGHTWCDPSQTDGEAKLFADGSQGYLVYASAGSILIKQFTDTPETLAAPGEAEIELYVNADHGYVEVENQGAYASIAPGQTVRWQVRWYARRLPPAISVTPGNADLVAFVTETLH